MVLAILINQSLIHDANFLFLILALNKVARFCNDARTFLCRRRANFLGSPIELIIIADF